MASTIRIMIEARGCYLVITWVFPTWLCSPVFAHMVDSRAEGVGLGVQD